MGRTSAEVKNRYAKKVYSRFSTNLKKHEYISIETALKEKGWSKAEFIRQAAKELLGVEYRENVAEEETKGE